MPHPPKSLPPSWGKVSRRTPRRMRGLPFPVPLFREGRDKPRPYGVTGNSPYLIGPDTPSGRAHKDGGRTMCAPTNWPKASRRGGFQPPEKPSPLRGKGVTAHAATDEGSSFPRPAFSRRAGQAPPLHGPEGISDSTENRGLGQCTAPDPPAARVSPPGTAPAPRRAAPSGSSGPPWRTDPAAHRGRGGGGGYAGWPASAATGPPWHGFRSAGWRAQPDHAKPRAGSTGEPPATL